MGPHSSHVALDTGHASRTHFSDPAASVCYRRPLFGGNIRCGSLPRNVRMHFAIPHNEFSTDYKVVLKGKCDSPIIRIAKKGAPDGGGAAPPTIEFPQGRWKGFLQTQARMAITEPARRRRRHQIDENEASQYRVGGRLTRGAARRFAETSTQTQ